MKTIQLRPAAVIALAPFVSTDEARPALAGICLRPDGKAVATQGHILGLLRRAHNSTEQLVFKPSPELVKLAKKADKKRHGLELRIEDGSAYAQVWSLSGVCMIEIVTEAHYPEVMQILPYRAESFGAIPSVQIDPRLLAKFGDDARLHFQTETRAIVIRTKNPDFYGLIMPRKTDEDREASPGWLRDTELLESAA
jgi:hypothetical protein